MSIAIISHEDCLLHEMPPDQQEIPDRLRTVNKAIAQFNFDHPINYVQAPLATKEQLKRAHASDYVENLFKISPASGLVELEYDTFLCPNTINAALRAAGAVIHAIDLVMTGKSKAAFCSIRPPGHHAEYQRAMGFCFFNNIAVGVKHLMEQYKLERILVIDFDVHHGNGTQDIFQDDGKVLFCSSFEHPLYPGYDPDAENDHILYLPLAAGTDSTTFRQAVTDKWLKKINKFVPQFIFISAGFDAHWRDPLGHLHLHAEDYVWITNQLVHIAKTSCEGRIVSVLEGGYSLEALAECVPLHVNALM